MKKLFKIEDGYLKIASKKILKLYSKKQNLFESAKFWETLFEEDGVPWYEDAYWIVEFNEYSSDFNGKLLTNELIAEIKKIDEECNHKISKGELLGYYKFYFQKLNCQNEELEQLRIDIGDGFERNKINFIYLSCQLNFCKGRPL